MLAGVLRTGRAYIDSCPCNSLSHLLFGGLCIKSHVIDNEPRRWLGSPQASEASEELEHFYLRGRTPARNSEERERRIG